MTIQLPLTHRDESPKTKNIWVKDLKSTFTDDVLDFLKQNDIEFVDFVQDQEQKYIHFRLWNKSAKEDFDYYWLQTVQGDAHSHGNLSVVNHGCCAAWYMNASFTDCLEVIEHIFQIHAGNFKIEEPELSESFELDQEFKL